MLHNNQIGKFFYFIAVMAHNFFLLTTDEFHSKAYLLSFKIIFQSILCDFFSRSYFTLNLKKLIFNFDARYLTNQTT